ncbi:MAG TPA: DUF2064 domain-containing protein [Acidocella sp.]|nr:DUF2064 domain-containing protein [Acidocella sp.]
MFEVSRTNQERLYKKARFRCFPAVNAAALVLSHGAAVFGPAHDGGYYLVMMGARRPARPFTKVVWPSEHALADTLHDFTDFRVGFSRVLYDDNRVEDLRRF